MKNQISNLENYTIKPKGSDEDSVQRCRFYYLVGETLWKEFDVEGHYDLESAFEYAKNVLADDVVQMALKESIKSLDIKSKNFHFIKDGETEDLRDYIFDQDILDKDSDLFKAFKKLLLDNWNEDIVWYYFRADAAKNANIHDDSDKKTLYNHYFDELKEFNDRISFLEYYDTINVDWYESRDGRGINYSFNKYGDYYCIDNTITRDEIYHFLIEKGIRVSEDIFLNNTLTWGAFAYYYGMNNGLSEIESISFASEIMELFGAHYPNGLYRFGLALELTNNIKGISAVFSLGLPKEFTKNIEIDKYIKESAIGSLLASVLSNNIADDKSKHTKEIFMTVFDIYKNHIQNFEYKTKRLEFRVSQRQYDQFMALPGKSKSDKLNALMEYPINKIPDSVLPNISFDEESRINWLKNNKVDYDYDDYNEDDYWYDFIKPSLEKKYGNDFEITVINSKWGCSSPKEEDLINNEGFDKRIDPDKARTKNIMKWMSECAHGAPSPLEMEYEEGEPVILEFSNEPMDDELRSEMIEETQSLSRDPDSINWGEMVDDSESEESEDED